MEALTKKEIAKIVEKEMHQFPESIEFVDEGNLNYVHRVKLPGEAVVYFKQALPEYRKPTAAIRQLPLKEDRLANEVSAIKLIKEYTHNNKTLRLPEVIYLSKRGDTAILSDVSNGEKSLKQKIEDGTFTPSDCLIVADALAIQHLKTTYAHETIRSYEEKFFNDIIYFRTVLSARGLDPKSRGEVSRMFEYIKSGKYISAIINGDFSPKQIFTNGKSIGLCDLEFACRGDPAFDVGFFLAHLEIAKILNDDPRISDGIDRFVSRYYNVLDPDDSFDLRVQFYTGTGMLNRIDAVPRTAGMTGEQVNRIRSRASELIV